MEFKKQKIRKKLKKTKRKKSIQHKKWFPIVASLVIVFLLALGVVNAISNLNFSNLLRIAGQELEQDAYGHTNILLLGTGGREHEGGNLTDSIIVASIDQENNLVSMLSIPRDLYIEDELLGSSRINEMFYKAKTHYGSTTEGLTYTKGLLEKVTGIPIHYYVQINFDGFKEFVDAIGGIDIYVPKAINDPEYPKDGTFGYEPFFINAGQHHMDGSTALKYARSRKTTNDFDRAERQQQILYAVKEKLMSSKIIFDKEKTQDVMRTLQENIKTNINIQEIMTLGSIAEDFSSERITHRLIHDDAHKCGGFLYPPYSEFYNNQFVLLPAGGFNHLHLYSELLFNHPQSTHTETKLHILNSTNRGGVAGEAKQILKRFCFDVVNHENGITQDKTETTYYIAQQYDEDGEPIPYQPAALDFLTRIIPGQISLTPPAEYQTYLNEADIIIEIGSNYVNSDQYLEDPFIYDPSLPGPIAVEAYYGAKPTQTTETETEDDTTE